MAKQEKQGVEMSTPVKLLVASNKGGTGKTTISCALAKELSKTHRVALLDTDVTGPNVIETLGVERRHTKFDKDYFYPIKINDQLEAFSPSMLIPDGMAITWWGESRGNIIKELFRKVKWSPYDLMIIDSPPGTGDELLTVLMTTPIDGVIIVTIGSTSSLNDAMRLVDMLQNEKFETPIMGVIDNMYPLFGEVDLKSLGVSILAKIPFANGGEKLTTKSLKPIVEEVEKLL